MKNLRNKIFSVAGVGFLLPMLVFAADANMNGTGSNTPTSPINNVQGLLNFMCTIFGWMFYFLVALSIVMICFAAFNYVTANGNAEKVSKANKMILYCAIGIAIALLAKGLPQIVGSFLNANGSLSSC